MTKSTEVLRLEAVSKSFPATLRGGEPIKILRSIDLDLQAATSVAIVGNSGSGKSTLLQISAGLLSWDSGSVHFETNDLSRLDDVRLGRLRSKRMGFIFQSSLLLNDFTAVENVQIAAMIGGLSRADARTEAKKLLDHVGLGSRLDHRSDQLSGGERQRVAIARALINKPAVLFADEPTGSLDERNASLIEDLLFSLVNEQEVALMLVTHNPVFAGRCNRTLHLSDGRVEEQH
jgi:lipoprotein-releasing system ATP-binding protein